MIKITDDTIVEMTKDEYQRMMADYQKAYMFYDGPPPSFERFVLARREAATKTGYVPEPPK